jgi:hypothetical protein
MNLINNRKTYLVAAIGVVVNGAIAMGYIDESQQQSINSVLGFLGLGTLRHGIKKAQRANGKSNPS